MKQAQYEEFVKLRQMEPVKRIQRGGYDIYISDGFCRYGDDEEPGPHYKTGYGFGRDDEIYLCEHFTTKMLSGQTPEERMQECVERAVEQLENFKETGCLRK